MPFYAEFAIFKLLFQGRLMESNYKNYELTYLLSPSILEGEVLTYAGKLTMLIEEAKGTVRRIEEPRKRRLASPIKKAETAYLGWTTFSSAPDHLSALEKKMKSLDYVLRYTFMEEEIEKRPQMLHIIPSRHGTGQPRPVPREAPKIDEKLDLEALDKKLEEILGK